MKNFFLSIGCFVSVLAHGQNGSIDNSFQIGTGADGNVYVLQELPDGRILLGGQFLNYNEQSVKGIARLLADGTLDASFNTGQGIDNFMLDAFIEPDGKMVIAGQFGSYNGVARNGIARLNADGTLDTTFSITDASVLEIAKVVKHNGKYIISGTFTSIGGQPRKNIARLNEDGSLDTGFEVGTGFNAGVAEFVVQSDNKIVVVGSFTNYNGIPQGRIARLNENGSLDGSFNTGTGFSSPVYSIALQQDGKVVVGGVFSAFNGTNKPLLVRLNGDGTLDSGFNAYTAYEAIATSVVVQQDGKIFVGGSLTSITGGDNKYFSRLNSDGSLDVTFNTGSGFDNMVNTISLQNNGKVLVGGWFSQYDGTLRNKIVRLHNTQNLEIPDFISRGFAIFPNPVKDSFKVQHSSEPGKGVTVSLFDLHGRKVSAGSFAALEEIVFDMSSFSKGVYVVKIESGFDAFVQKIVKE